MNCKHTYGDFTSKVQSYISGLAYNIIFTCGGVRRLQLNGREAFLWIDAKGNICYSFDLFSQEYQTTSIAKFGNAVSSHFQCNIEAENNAGESLKKVTGATIGLNKAISESERYDFFTGYPHNGFMERNSTEFDLNQNMNQNLSSNQALVPQQDRFNQKQLYGDIINLSVYQLQFAQNTFYIYVNELPIVHKEVFRPVSKHAFFIEKGLTIRNKYIPSEYLTKYGYSSNLSDSFILSFIFAMAKNG